MSRLPPRELGLAVKRLVRRACEDTGVSIRQLAALADRCPSVVERQLSELAPTHPVPLYVEALVPRATRGRIRADLDALADGPGLVAGAEAAAAGLVARAGEVLTALGEALADGRVSAAEARGLRALLARYRTQLEGADRALAALEGRS